MRILVTGATGNVGSEVIVALSADDAVTEVVGFARRHGGPAPSPKVSWTCGDVRDADAIRSAVEGADAVVHLAWSIQPSRDREHTRAVNVDGSRNVFAAAAGADSVRALVYASSVGTYSPAPDARPHDETWPREGIDSSFYSRDKAEVEKLLDGFQSQRLRVVRLRPALIFQRRAAAEIRRLFAGPFLPGSILRRGLLPVVPDISSVRFQAVHTSDVADAYRRAVLDDRADGAYNIATDPVLTTRSIAEILGARAVPLPFTVTRGAAWLTFKARLQPTPPGWLDMAAGAPIMDSARARRELGWQPARDGKEALEELLAGLRDGAGGDTPPLRADAGGPGRIREILTGVGART